MRKLKRWGIRIGGGIATYLIVRAVVGAVENAGLPLTNLLSGLVGGFLAAGVLVWLLPGLLALAVTVGLIRLDRQAPFEKVVSKEAPKEAPPEPPVGIEQLFKEDFNLMKLTGEVTLTRQDGTKLIYMQQIYQDYETNTEFAGFFVPRSQHALEIMTWLPTGYREQYDKLRSGIRVQMKSPLDLTSVSNSTLTFTGRVYIYHEDELTLRQIADLTDLFATNGMHLVLRGPSYATQSWLAKTRK